MSTYFSKLVLRGIITLGVMYLVYLILITQMAESGMFQTLNSIGINFEAKDILFSPIETVKTLIEAPFKMLENTLNFF